MRKYVTQKTGRSRSLRAKQTQSERLLWSILRAKQLCELKFRRPHPIGPFFADFASVQQRLIIEIDGGYHDVVQESDLERERYLNQHGWVVIRFTDEAIEQDAEAVARTIAKHLGWTYGFRKRRADGTGMENIRATNRRLR